MHLILLGDSVFDNGAYVGGAPDVVRQVQARLPRGARATLLALDGAVTRDVVQQAARIPPDATHLVVSAGGNDALGHMSVLDDKSHSIAGALARLADIQDGFARDYAVMLDAVLTRGLPVALCTIYDPRFPDPMMRRLGALGLALFNDAILRAAFARGLPALDLRLICSEDLDFANPIEPSKQGGDKIAASIVRVVSEHPFKGRAEVFAR